jgi:penicillin-insensitive murein endopeptidase
MHNASKTLILFKKLAGSLVSVAAALTLLVACGDTGSKSNADKYVYKNPDKGTPVKLKEADTVNRLAEAAAKPNKKAIRLYDGFFKVDIKTLEVSFRFKRDTPAGETIKTDEILLVGKLKKDENGGINGWIDDAEAKKLKGSRAFAYVACFPDDKGNVCAQSYVSVRYADENGEEKEKQFHASPRAAAIKKRKEKEASKTPPKVGPAPNIVVVQPDQTKPPVINMPPAQQQAPTPVATVEVETSFEPEIVTQIDEKEYSIIEEKVEEPKKPVQTGPKVSAEGDIELSEGDTHKADDDDTGVYVTPQSPEEKQQGLIGAKKGTPSPPAPPKPNTPKPQVSGTKPQSTLGIPLNLDLGGIAKLTPNNGSMTRATPLPSSGAGFKRHSNEAKAYGSGFLLSFLQDTARRFAMDNPNCEQVHVNQIALKNGGFFRGHASHRNGTDADISYFQPTPWTDVVTTVKTTIEAKSNKKRRIVNRATTSNSFKVDCFLKYLKFMDDQKFANTGDSRFDGADIVDLVFVNPGVQNGVCSYVKKNNLMDVYGSAVNLMYPEKGHESHFHLRVRCSPKHINCVSLDFDRRAPFKKRGCR